MKLIKEIREIDVLQNSNIVKDPKYSLRRASRVVAFNNLGKIALVSVDNDRFYKLPGGGIEFDEDSISSLRREVKEEVGYALTEISEYGLTIEFRSTQKLIQISYVYTAKIVGSYIGTEYTNKEKTLSFKVLWVSLDEAAIKLSEGKSDKLNELFIINRDRSIIESYAQNEKKEKS